MYLYWRRKITKYLYTWWYNYRYFIVINKSEKFRKIFTWINPTFHLFISVLPFISPVFSSFKSSLSFLLLLFRTGFQRTLSNVNQFNPSKSPSSLLVRSNNFNLHLKTVLKEDPAHSSTEGRLAASSKFDEFIVS